VPKKTFNTEKLVCRDKEGDDKESAISEESEDEDEGDDVYHKNK